MNRPSTRKTRRPQRPALSALFEGRGHALTKNPKNKYVDFEVRTDGRSIFTLYTSGKLVSTVREGDAEGLLLEAGLAELLGEAQVSAASRPVEAAQVDAAYLAGSDETGTGEVLGTTIIGGALLPVALQGDVARLVGHVETKTSRTNGGWERLGEGLVDLRPAGLVLVTRVVSNALFDRYSKNALLDVAYVRLLADLLAAAPADATRAGLACVIDDYGAGAVLRSAQTSWTRAGRRLALETKADDNHLAARAASVLARAARAREMIGLNAEIEDGPIGTGNAGHRETRAWLRKRAGSGAWPACVKTSFKTVTQLDGSPLAEKRRVPALDTLIPKARAQAFLNGDPGALSAGLLDAQGRAHTRLEWTRSAGLSLHDDAALWLPLLAGGLVFDPEHELPAGVLEREGGLAAGWRVLGPSRPDLDSTLDIALARAHRSGILDYSPCRQDDPVERARHHGAVLVRCHGERVILELAPS